MKYPLSIITTVFIMIGLSLTGCSSQNRMPNAPDMQSGEQSNHDSWGAYEMFIDTDAKTIEIIPDRETMFHFNVTSYMSMCPGGCFTFRIVNIVGTVLEIEMTLKNPVKLNAYDVRIIFTRLYGKTVMNPDSYTDLFDPPSTPETINPFIAFRREDPDRRFPESPSSDTETLFIDFPPGTPSSASWIIDASFPANCGEPYEINNMNFSGRLTPSGGTGIISCVVLDHQDNITSVTVDTTPITGGISSMNQTPMETWETQITNSQGAPVGDYPCLIKAQSPDPSNASTYNYVIVIVSEETGEACEGALNFFVTSDGNWVVESTIEQESNKQLLTNLLDYTPSGPAVNYHTFYYWGGKGGSFRNGSTINAQLIAESLGYTFRKQEYGDLDLTDVRVLFWPALGSGDTSNQPSDTEINAMKNLLAEGGRIIISFEYDITSPDVDAFINNQFQRLGTSIRKLPGGEPTNLALTPEECEAFSHDIGKVLFRAWGYIDVPAPEAEVLYYSPDGDRVMVAEIL